MENKHVPFLNLTKLHARYQQEFMSALGTVVGNSRFISGPELDAFEKEFAQWIGPGFYAVGCANGTDAIMLAAKAMDFAPGSEAIVPAMTFVATVEGLMHAGLKVRLVDVKEGTWLLDPEKIEAACTPQTRLIAPVHLYGQMAPMDAIRKIADTRRCAVFEDAAQAHGARWKDQPVGHWGDVASYSFFPGKNLGAFGDGGAVASKSKDLIQKCSMLGKHGGIKKYEHLLLGHNSRLDDIQAAVLRVKLRHLDSWNQRRRQIAGWYKEMLSDVPDIQLPVEALEAKHVYHLYVALVEDREAVGTALKAKGVETGVHYPLAIHQLPAFKGQDFSQQRFPHAERIAKHGLSLPMCPTLEEADIEYAAKSIRSFFGK